MNRTREEARTDELLSAYIDGELEAGTRARLETRLEQEPALRGQLEELRQTVTLVQAMPRVEAPRNFLLTPTMASPRRDTGRQRSRSIFDRWLAPALSFATGVSAILLVLTLTGGFLRGFTEDRVAAPLAPTLAVEVAEAPPPEDEEGEAPEMLLTAPTEEAEGTPLAMQAGEGAPPEEAEAEGAPAPTETSPDSGDAAPTGEPVGGGGVRPTPSPQSVAEEDGENLEYDLSPTPESDQVAEAPALTGRANPEEDTAEEEPVAPLPLPPEAPASEALPAPVRWILPLGLALLTLILIVATILAWRVQRPR